jgi:hypothetical protein
MARSRTKRTFCHNNDILGQVTNETDLLPQQLYPWPGHERNGPSATCGLTQNEIPPCSDRNGLKNYSHGQVTNETDLLPHNYSQGKVTIEMDLAAFDHYG